MKFEVHHKSHLTAIHRKSIPTPVKWILSNENISGNILDFGCGKCKSINPKHWDSYDPYYNPNGITKPKYNIILCTYVLCVLNLFERLKTLNEIKSLLDKNGIAYIIVRNDKPKRGWGLSNRKTFQSKTPELNSMFPCIRSNSSYKIFKASLGHKWPLDH